MFVTDESKRLGRISRKGKLITIKNKRFRYYKPEIIVSKFDGVYKLWKGHEWKKEKTKVKEQGYETRDKNGNECCRSRPKIRER